MIKNQISCLRLSKLVFLVLIILLLSACSHFKKESETTVIVPAMTATVSEVTVLPPIETTVGYVFPLSEYKLSGKGKFVWRRRHMHKGVDLLAPKGTPIYAIEDGTVLVANYVKRSGYGRKVIIDHGNGLTSAYAHTSENKVSTGDKVARGQLIALVGSTGRSTANHLHFEIRIENQPINPLLYITSGTVEGPPEAKKKMAKIVKIKKKKKNKKKKMK